MSESETNSYPGKKHLLAGMLLWKELHGRKMMNYRFERQRNLFGHIVDFYCYDLKLVVLVTPFHKGTGFKHEQEVESLLESKRMNVLRFDYNMIIEDMPTVISTIQKWIHNFKSESIEN